jgi:hypothetical protein
MEQTTRGISSHTYWKPFAIFDPDTQSLRMFEDTLLSDLTPFSATLPQSGMMRNGVLFELPISEQPIKEQGFTLLPTPMTTDSKGTSPSDARRNSPGMRAVRYFDWDRYKPVIRRWEKVIDRKAPKPMIGKKLNPKFTEWMMGLPDGWVTDVEITWSEQIKACGNGVVPQAAAEALKRLA